MTRVLFICTHNSGRSQMAEAYLNLLGGGDFEAESAGLEPRAVNSYVVMAMFEQGIDISDAVSKSVFETFKAGKFFDYIITVCDDADSECPIYPSMSRCIHYPFHDTSSYTGTPEDTIAQVRVVRDAIKEFVLQFILDARRLNYQDSKEKPVVCQAKPYMTKNTSSKGRAI